jgi:hypothetical protein
MTRPDGPARSLSSSRIPRGPAPEVDRGVAWPERRAIDQRGVGDEELVTLTLETAGLIGVGAERIDGIGIGSFVGADPAGHLPRTGNGGFRGHGPILRLPGGSAAARVSASVTPMPRRARSIAKLMPTGLPLTTKTSVLIWRDIGATSFGGVRPARRRSHGGFTRIASRSGSRNFWPRNVEIRGLRRSCLDRQSDRS